MPSTIILMGVCGSGKTLIGETLVQRVGGSFADADAFHTDAARAKMNSGTPLTDEDRWPWLQRLREHILQQRQKVPLCVIACSALRQSYRDVLRGQDTPQQLAFVHLHGSPELIRQRMAARTGHYMPVALLDSQLATLEAPADALVVDITGTPEEIVNHILQALSL